MSPGTPVTSTLHPGDATQGHVYVRCSLLPLYDRIDTCATDC